MDRIENEKYVNARSVIELVNNDRARAEKVPAFLRLIAKLEEQVNLISTTETQSKQDTKGATQDKNKTKGNVKESVVRLSQVMLAFANENEDSVLENKVKAMRTKLSKAKQSEFPTQCKEVLTEAKTLNGSLAEYGFTMDMLLDLEAQVDYFDSKTPQTTHLKTQKKTATKNKKKIFSQVSKITNKQIKNAAAAYIGVDDAFYDNIMDCIKMKKRAASSPTQIKVTFTMPEGKRSLMAIQDIKDIKDAMVVETKRIGKVNEKGEMFFKMSKGGKVSLNIPLPNGEVRFISDVEVKRGKTTEVQVAL